MSMQWKSTAQPQPFGIRCGQFQGFGLQVESMHLVGRSMRFQAMGKIPLPVPMSSTRSGESPLIV